MRAWLASLLTLTFASSAPALASERQVWGIEKTDEAVHLYYGVPESDALTIAFVCKTRTKKIEIVSSVLPDKPKKDEPITTILRNGKASADHDGKVAGDSEDGFHFATEVTAEPKVTDVLKGGSALVIRVRGKQQRVPLRGSAKPLAEFEKLCFG